MRKLAICVPTYNRPEVIYELLLRYMAVYRNLKYDVYIFDSSEGDETEDRVEQFIDKYENLFYIRMDSTIHSNMKVYQIYQLFQNKKEYEYIWVCSDAIRWTEKALDEINRMLQKEYDLLIPNYRDVEHIGIREYSNYNDLFGDCAWYMTLYGATILKIATVLHDVDWNYFIEKYGVQERINFSHVALYFEQLCKMKEFLALHLSLERKSLVSSPYKKESGWTKDTFYVFCTCWPSMVMALPDCYLDKMSVVKKCGVNSGILEIENMIKLRKENIYNYKVFKRYHDKWKVLTDTKWILLFFISIIPKGIVIYLSKKERTIRKIKRNIKKFCKRYSVIYIYGCGSEGGRFASFLDELNIRYKGFLVTSLDNEKKQFLNHNVYKYERDILDNSNVGIIIAINESNFKQVFPSFKGKEKRIYSEFL